MSPQKDILTNGHTKSPPNFDIVPLWLSHGPHNACNSCAPVLTTPNNSVTANSSANFANSGGGNNGNNSSRRSPVRTAASRLSEAPRTPTPFKKALADVYQRREPLSRTVSAVLKL